MAIACPYCAHRITLKPAKVGRYRPTCPNCAQSFLVWISEDTGTALKVRPLLNETPSRSPHSSTPTLSIVRTPVAAGVTATTNEGEPHLFGLAQTNPDHIQSKDTDAHRSPGPSCDTGNAVDDEPSIAPRTEIRGYTIEHELGRGGMGRVYLAKQLSLDRPVALKVMSKRWAADPVFVARFTREAFAAAQLYHPNIVQIHDIGEAEGARFFSMEYVRGKSLADIVREQGKLDPETAVGYALQAARGLKHAHDRSMIHRDVKPDNILVDDQGLVKVADLGLVKTLTAGTTDEQLPESSSKSGLLSLPPEMTGVRIALGTPAYMSPEQCRDAATVDHRADIYSLGCTLYVMVTGRPPFDGTTAVELMSKHAYDPLVPPEQIVSRVPKEISAVIQRMMAKDAADRYQDMGEVIRTLEAWLGVHRTGTFSPQEEQIARLEGYVFEFNTCAPAVLRNRLVSGFFGAVALIAVLLAFFGKLDWAFGVFGLAAQSALAYFVVDGIARRGHMFGIARGFLAGMSLGDIAMGVAAFGMFCILLALLKVFWIWFGFGIMGVALAFVVCYGLDRAVILQRRGILDGCERQLRRLRMQGLDEEELRQFVAKFAGRDWEEFFEALFGYEAKLVARGMLLRGGVAGTREKHAAWREPIISWMESVEKSRKEARERKLLEAVEQAKLLAVGESIHSAEQQAKATAAAIVRAAGAVRQADTSRVRPGFKTQQAPAISRTVMRPGVQPNDFPFAQSHPKRDPLGRFVSLLVGPHIRTLASLFLIVMGVTWVAYSHAMEPLVFEGVPSFLTSWVDSFNVGLAGLLLLGSLYFRGNLMGIFALVGAGVAVLGHHFGVRPIEPFSDYHVSLMLGTLLAIVGFRLGTR